jgi:hypothetical protein
MEKRKSNLLFFLVIVFIIGMVGFFLHSYFVLPQNLIAAIGGDTNLFEEIQPIFLPSMVYAFVVFSFATGLITWLFIERQRNVTKEIIYIEKFIEQEKVTKKEDTEQTTKLTEQLPLLKKELTNATSETRFQLTINHLCNITEAVAGAFFIAKETEALRYVELIAAYAYQIPDSKTLRFEYGEGLVGQIAKEGKALQISAIPEGYIRILSGLGQSTPSYLLLLPIKNKEGVLIAVVEMANFKEFSKEEVTFIEEISSHVFL